MTNLFKPLWSATLMRERLSRLRQLTLLGGVLLFALAACGSLPDVSPFAAATSELGSAVEQIGPAVSAEVAKIPDSKGWVDDLDKAWAARVLAIDAMVEYSNSVAAIVNAGNEGSESAEKLGAAFTGLTKKAGGLIPGAEALAPIGDAVAFLTKTVISIRATSDLLEALEAAQPGVTQFSKLLAADLEDMGGVVTTANTGAMIKRKKAVAGKFSTLTGLRAQREKRQKKYLDALKKNSDHIDAMAERVSTGTGAQPAGSIALTQPPVSKAELEEMIAELKQIDAVIASNKSWLDPYEAGLKKDAERLMAAQQLITASQTAIRRWAAAHASLIVAVRESRVPSFHSLIKTAVEIEDLVKKLKTI
jgi:hypothetical protein